MVCLDFDFLSSLFLFIGLFLIETVELGRQESLAAIGKRELSHRELEKEARRMIGNDLDDLWKRAQEMK
jgi:hypothetical protein